MESKTTTTTTTSSIMETPLTDTTSTFKADFGPNVKVPGYSGMHRAFSARVLLDEHKGPEGSQMKEGEKKERTIEELIDLGDLSSLTPKEFAQLPAYDREANLSKVRVLQMLAIGAQPKHKGRGCEILINDKAVFFLELQNRDPEKLTLAEVKINGLVAGCYVLRPNEKLNVRHPAVGLSDDEKKKDKKKWVVYTQDEGIARAAAKGERIGAMSKELKDKVVSECASIEVKFFPEVKTTETGIATRGTSNPPGTYDPKIGLADRATMYDTGGKTRTVFAVASKANPRPALKPVEATMGKRKATEDFTTPKAAGQHACYIGQGDDFSAMLY